MLGFFDPHPACQAEVVQNLPEVRGKASGGLADVHHFSTWLQSLPHGVAPRAIKELFSLLSKVRSGLPHSSTLRHRASVLLATPA